MELGVFNRFQDHTPYSMYKVQYHTTREPHWPNKCAFCGKVATERAKASLNQYCDLEYLGIFARWCRKRHSVSYPVCQRHKRLASILNKPSEWGPIISTLLFLLISPLVVLMPVSTFFELVSMLRGTALPLSYSTMILSCCLVGYCLGGFFFVACYVLRPVRLSHVSATLGTLFIRRMDCLEEFKDVNRDIIKA